MRAGTLRRPVTIEEPADPPTQTDSGHEIEVWDPIPVAPETQAAIEAPSGLERVLAQQKHGEVRAIARLRYRDDLDETMRLVDRQTDEVWLFDGPPTDPTGRKHEMQIPVVRRG